MIIVSAGPNNDPARIVEIIESFGYRIWSMYIQLQGDVCPECFGRVDTVVDVYEHNEKTIHPHVCSCRECIHVISYQLKWLLRFTQQSSAYFGITTLRYSTFHCGNFSITLH